VSIKGPELLTMWFGESEANVREVFTRPAQRHLVSYSSTSSTLSALPAALVVEVMQVVLETV